MSMEEMQNYRELILDNIEYDHLCRGDAAQHVDAELPFPIQGQVVLGLGHDGAHAQQQRGDTQLFGLRLDARHKAHMGLLAQGAVALQPGLGGDGEPGFP